MLQLRRAISGGWRTTFSHGFCLGDITERKAAAVVEAMAEAAIALR